MHIQNVDTNILHFFFFVVKHLKHENPSFSPTFQKLVDAMSEYFDVEVYATRLNFYPDNSSWKPFHHDSHAYGSNGKKEDFTMGASFGFTRSLVFKHVKTEQQFGFPQENGDVFAFSTKINKQFQHGVPKDATGRSGPRFSIIAWGRRKSMTGLFACLFFFMFFFFFLCFIKNR